MEHKPQLDGLRLLAFLGVFAHHVHFFPAASRGVHLFFCLSGFLIGRILFLHHATPGSYRRFYARRALRIFPLYYAVVTALMLAGKVAYPWLEILFLRNFEIAASGRWDGTHSHFWTLCVEEQFYLLLPLALALTPSRAHVALLVTGVAASLLFAFVAVLRFPEYPLAFVLLPYAAMFLLVGALFAYVDVHAPWLASRATPLLAAGIAITAASSPFIQQPWLLPAFTPVIDLTQALGFSALVYGLCHADRGITARALALPPFRYLGRISYGLYVLHVPIKAAVWELPMMGELAVWPRAAALFALTALGASLSWALLERPFLALKRLVPYRTIGRTS